MIRSLVVAVLGIASLVGSPAHADNCDADILPRALGIALVKPVNAQALLTQAREMDGYVQACPEHPWINMLGANTNMMLFRALLQANNGSFNQDAVNQLAQAFARTQKYYGAPAALRHDRIRVSTPSGIGNLTYGAAAKSRSEVIQGLMALARVGVMHPYLGGKEPLSCDGWLMSDTQTVTFAITSEKDRLYLPFIDAAAQACRNASSRFQRLPQAMQARAYMTIVQKGDGLDDPERQRLLEVASRAAQDYIEGHGYDVHFPQSAGSTLDALRVKYAGGETLNPDDWFTPDRIESPQVVHAMALTLNQYWTPEAAGVTDASSDAVAKARAQIGVQLFRMRQQGQQAGLGAQTSASLKRALSAFQSGDIRTSETKDLPGLPQSLFDSLSKLISTN